MMITKTKLMQITSNDDIVIIRHATRALAVELGFTLVDQTKIVTASSELARNAFEYAGGGTVTFEALNDGGRSGLRLVFEDKGPGIKDVELALKDGFSTSGGLGFGLGGAKRLVNEFEITSTPGKGTTVSITRWK